MNLEVIKQEASGDVRPTPILFVHGMWHAAWCWAEHFAPYLAQQGYTSYSVSLRGHGASEGRRRLRWTSLHDYVSDLEQVVAGLTTAPVLVGHSMGGFVVQKFLESHPVPAAVLLASVPPKGVLPATLRYVSRHPFAFIKANLTLSMYPIVGTPQLAHDSLFSPAMPDGKVRAYFARLQDESYRAYVEMMGFTLPRPGRVKTPLLVLGAAGDRLIVPGDVEATARAYATRAEIMTNMAHDMMLDDGWPRVADRIRSWLSEQGL